jgi:hypothetical protein
MKSCLCNRTGRKEKKMKATFKYILSVSAVGFAFALMPQCLGGPGIIINPPTVVISPPAVVVSVPPPAVEVQVAVPDYYVWDGYEYVGVVGSQYYYLGPGNVWLVCDPVRFQRFHTWEGGHPDWRTHATHNVHYRNSSGHNQPQPKHDNQPTHNQPMNDKPDKRSDQGHNVPGPP